MSNFLRSRNLKNIFILVSFGIVVLILWNTYGFSKEVKEDERFKMEIWAKAYEHLESADNNEDLSLVLKIIQSNQEIQMLVTDKKGRILEHKNLDPTKASDTLYIKEQLNLMKNENNPIVINYLGGKQYLIYYRNSDLLMRLRYYPITLLFILGLFAGVFYLVFRTVKISEQNKLWTGMAKETAHQIGTPLSSLLGWIEIMKLKNQATAIVPEIEKDIIRLKVIADRFSKIGSTPVMLPMDIGKVIENTVAYFEMRISKNIDFKYELPDSKIQVSLNKELFSWVLENLIKNAIDSIASKKGYLEIKVVSLKDLVEISVSDSGKGIPKSRYKEIFKPGFTTKKRGWGLGLSLCKRIVEDYHSGSISVKESKVEVGTTFLIQLKKLASDI